jgi:DNA-binding NarL/FixJ family response regulator
MSLLRGLRILIISDDNAVAKALVQFVFEGLGVEIIGMPHFSDNLYDWLTRFTPDIALMYVQTLTLEKVEYIEQLLLKLRADHFDNPILVLTQTKVPVLHSSLLRAGCQAVLAPMPTREELLVAISSVEGNSNKKK